MENQINYSGLDFSRDELSSVMKECYEDIISFITQEPFQQIFAELMNLKPVDRPQFVNDIILNKKEMRARGLEYTDGILVQTSAFGDRRPTLFVVKKFLPEKYHVAWENVNWTFNNDFKNEDVPFDNEASWRLPLKVSIQNALLSKDIDLQSVPDNYDNYFQLLDGDDIVKSEKTQSYPK